MVTDLQLIELNCNLTAVLLIACSLATEVNVEFSYLRTHLAYIRLFGLSFDVEILLEVMHHFAKAYLGTQFELWDVLLECPRNQVTVMDTR